MWIVGAGTPFFSVPNSVKVQMLVQILLIFEILCSKARANNVVIRKYIWNNLVVSLY